MSSDSTPAPGSPHPQVAPPIDQTEEAADHAFEQVQGVEEGPGAPMQDGEAG